MRKTVFLFLLSALSFTYAQHSTLTRSYDPVIMTGADLPEFNSLQPGRIVGFKFANGAWTQVPVQIDERAELDIISPYGTQSWINFSFTPKITFYCCASTFVGSDADALFDTDDELVFMVKDAGGKSDGTLPVGVVAGSCKEIQVSDPLGGTGYVYLFESDGTLQPGAGIAYVSLNSNVSTTSGFPVNFNFLNPENTTVSTSFYSWHFSSEWVSDELRINSGGGADILDRYKNFFVDGDCTRHEDSFSEGENAFVAIKEGPLRVIRSYMGAQSGPLTQRTHFFYENRHDIATDLRVHNIASIYDAFDYNSNAAGMTYRNNLDTTGVLIDGQHDSVAHGELEWEQVSGTQGALTIVHRRSTNLTAADASFVGYYDDDTLSPASDCTGDGQAWGTSGIGIEFANGSVCTDPILGGCAGTQWLRVMQAQRIMYTAPPGTPALAAEQLNIRINHPLIVNVSNCQITSINEFEMHDPDVMVYPNPADNHISFRTTENVKVKIYNALGKNIMCFELDGDERSVFLSDEGIYFAEIIAEGGRRTFKRLVIQ